MKERFKTFLLLSLVCISVIFTKKLWIQLPNEIFGMFKKEEVVSASYLLSDMITPNKYLLNFNENNHTLLYDDNKYNLWTSTRGILADVLDSKNIKTADLSNEEFLSYHRKRSIIFYFPEKINTYILAKALDVKDPNSIADIMPSITSIYLYLGKDDTFFVFSTKDEHLAVYDLTIDTKYLRDQLISIEEAKDYTRYYSIESFGIKNDIYIPDEMSNTLPTVYVENEISSMDEHRTREIAKKFFNKDIDYIKEIIENNGSAIYVYNQRVLKINKNGLLEYFHPLEESVGERNLYVSLNSAADFISKNIGIPRGMYLAKIEEIESEAGLGYRLTFRYRIRGIPVVLGSNEIEDFIQIDVFNKYIRNYKQFIRKDMKIKADSVSKNNVILSPFDVIDMNYGLLEKRYIQYKEKEGQEVIRESIADEILSSIEDITLAYFDPCLKDKEDKLIGVWLIKTGGRIYAFDVSNGRLVFEKN
jgi:regulatory protein YycH of two-component signal transduction system YycFG